MVGLSKLTQGSSVYNFARTNYYTYKGRLNSAKFSSMYATQLIKKSIEERAHYNSAIYLKYLTLILLMRTLI